MELSDAWVLKRSESKEQQSSTRKELGIADKNKNQIVPCATHWTLEDLFSASELLTPPPHRLVFVNEFEMRRIFTMLFDVYRRKYYFIDIPDPA